MIINYSDIDLPFW